jgi:hypothetical protein
MLQMTLAHPAEKYSSAAPLTADARQRIVYERFDLRKFVTASMTVGPASGVLKDVSPEQWKAKDVALTVLIDRWGWGVGVQQYRGMNCGGVGVEGWGRV